MIKNVLIKMLQVSNDENIIFQYLYNSLELQSNKFSLN